MQPMDTRGWPSRWGGTGQDRAGQGVAGEVCLTKCEWLAQAQKFGTGSGMDVEKQLRRQYP